MDEKNRIKTIILYCENIGENINRFGKDIEDFLDDPAYQQACSFCIAQIGENIKPIISELNKKCRKTQWREIAGMRGVISHGYHKIDLDRIWIFITEEVPDLKETCERILYNIENP